MNDSTARSAKIEHYSLAHVPALGHTAQRYAVFAQIGSGGMAEVHLAVASGNLGVNRLVVLKRLRANLMDEDECYAHMFLDEARLAVRLTHPNIVHTYDVGMHEGSLFMVMEYLEGQPLKRLRDHLLKVGHPMPMNLAVQVVAKTLAGLHHAHELRDYDGTPLGVIHRDVSPHNIFVTYDGEVKLLDFGIAKATLNLTQTAHGALKGKPNYMAPEQVTCASYDRRADIFAMGIVLFELVTNTRLFPGDTIVAINRLTTFPIPRASSLRPEVDSTLDEIIHTALERDPDKRYATAEQMRAALDAWLREKQAQDQTQALSDYMSEVFKLVRERIQQRIQEKMSEISRIETQHSQTDLITNLTSSGVIQSSRIFDPDSGSISPPRGKSLPPAAPPTRTRSRKGIAFALAALCAVTAVTTSLVIHRAKAPEPVAAKTTSAAIAEPPSPKDAPLEPAPTSKLAPSASVDAQPAALALPQQPALRPARHETRVAAVQPRTKPAAAPPQVQSATPAAPAPTASAITAPQPTAPRIRVIEETRTNVRVVE